MIGNSYWILLVEDDPSHATLIKAVFSHGDADAHVHVTRSAEEAIAYLQGPWPDEDFGRDQLPDIIVLDIEMEGIGGLGFLEWYARQSRIQHLPVVVFTSSDDADLARRCMTLGAREFKVKPADFSELVPVVHQVLDRWGAERDKDSRTG